MRVIPFEIPKNSPEAFRVQHDQVKHLYNHLHQHPEIQLTLIKESHGTLVAGDYVGPFHPGDVFIIGSNQPHVFRNEEQYFRKKSKAETITVFFDERTLGKEFWQLPEMKGLHAFLQNSAGGFRVSGHKRKWLAERLEALLTAKQLHRLVLFMEILTVLQTRRELHPLSKATISRQIKSYDGNRLNRIMEFTFREYYRTITLKEVAALANLTPEAFCKYFKTRTRKTYTLFLNEIRINKACQLLQEDHPVASVCYDCGFTNRSNFNRIFKKIKKTAPARWRKQQLSS